MAKNEKYVFEKLSASKVSGMLVKEEVWKVGVLYRIKINAVNLHYLRLIRNGFVGKQRSHLSFAHLYKGLKKKQ